MEILFIIGRVLFAFLFLGSAFGHFAQREAMTGYAKYKNVPAAGLSVVVTGIMLLAGGLSILLGIYPVIGSLLLAAFLIPTAFIMHNFWSETDAQAKQNTMISFNKDLSLGGAALILAYFFANTSDLPFILLG